MTLYDLVRRNPDRAAFVLTLVGLVGILVAYEVWR